MVKSIYKKLKGGKSEPFYFNWDLQWHFLLTNTNDDSSESVLYNLNKLKL